MTIVYTCVAVAALILIVLCFFAYKGAADSALSSLHGVWSLNDADRSIFGLKDYVMYVKPQEAGELQCYLLVSNDKCVLYDDVVDLVQIPGVKDQFQVISYGSPILPSTVSLIMNDKKNVIELKDQDVLLIRLRKVNSEASDVA